MSAQTHSIRGSAPLSNRLASHALCLVNINCAAHGADRIHRGSQVLSLVRTPMIKRAMARKPGHLDSLVDAGRTLPQKSAQRYQIVPIAMTPLGMPGRTPLEP